jgi:hypothetical protein
LHCRQATDFRKIFCSVLAWAADRLAMKNMLSTFISNCRNWLHPEPARKVSFEDIKFAEYYGMFLKHIEDNKKTIALDYACQWEDMLNDRDFDHEAAYARLYQPEERRQRTEEMLNLGKSYKLAAEQQPEKEGPDLEPG